MKQLVTMSLIVLWPLTGLSGMTWDQSDWLTYGGDWQVQGDEISVVGKGGPRAMLKPSDYSDFELTVDVQLSKGTQAGVVFRVSDSQVGVDAYRGYYVGLNTRSGLVLWGSSDHQWQGIASKPMPAPPGNWQRLRLRVVGDNVKLWVGDEITNPLRFPRIDGVDKRFQMGAVGLRVLGGNARFRNFKIGQISTSPGAFTYSNPVQPACADPVVLLHEGTYYAYCTYSPDYPNMPKGIRLYTSADLVHWTDRGYVLKNEDSWGKERFWAPDIVEKDNRFYLFYAADTRICVATADTPMGPFTQSRRVPMEPDHMRIDAHVFQDDDGQYYLYYVHFNKGNEIWGCTLNEDLMSVDASTRKLMVKPDQPWEQHRGRVVEGAEVIKHKGIYYLTYSGSHFQHPNYGVGYATATHPLGPWKKYTHNPIMKSTAYAHGTAHHCLTTSSDGKEMFIVYHRHHTLDETEPRQMAIDRIQFVPQKQGPDLLEVWGPTSSPQPMPSGVPQP